MGFLIMAFKTLKLESVNNPPCSQISLPLTLPHTPDMLVVMMLPIIRVNGVTITLLPRVR